MMTITDKNNLAYSLHNELLKATERFARKCPKADIEVFLGAGNLFIGALLVGNAPTKEHAAKTLESCVDVMKGMIDTTPDNLFGRHARNLN